jgi:hypothetical protein
MLELLRWRRQKPVTKNARRSTRLALLRLEARDCPAIGLGDGATHPIITSFTAAAEPGHMAYLSGTVDDCSPATVTVYFSGAACGSTTCDASGNFNYTPSNARLGAIYAKAVNAAGLASARSLSTLSVLPPTLTLSLGYGSQRTVTLSGQVSDIDAGSLTITFGGEVSASVVTNPDGTFTLTTQAAGLGNVQAVTTNRWGETSNTAQVTVSATAPVITSFIATMGSDNLWTFSGTVSDKSAAGLIIYLGGISGLSGQTATVGADGTFCVTVQLAAGVQGDATAQTTDWWGLNSNVAMQWI